MNAASATSGLRLRRDLICQKLEMAPRAMWVLKDPLSKELHYVSDDEYAILKLLDGNRTLSEVFSECTRYFKSQFIAPDAFIGFLAEAKRKQLITLPSNRPEVGKKTASKFVHPRDTVGWSSLLAYRLPGFRPGRLLDLLSNVLEGLAKPLTACVYVLLTVAAGIVAYLNLPVILEATAEAFAQRGSHTWLQLFIVIAIVKIIHELAHAVACRMLGRDCRELGVMLLMGIPCLYCDVSDAWLMPERYKRILVSAAGILAEVALASLAVFVWTVSSSEVLSQWCLIVMTVCSVSTLLINGNPLMRYDGYFIFSDIAAVPNLGARSTQALQKVVQKYVWQATLAPQSLDRISTPSWLPIYATASLLYRIFVFGSMAWMLFRFTVERHLAVPGIILGLAIAIAALMPELRTIFAMPPRVFVTNQPVRFLTPLRVSGLLLALILLFVPLPRTITVPMHIAPADAQTVYASSNGSLTPLIQAGEMVRKGDPIGTIKNYEKDLALIESEMQLAQLTTARQNLETIRQSQSEMSASFIAATAAEAAASERVALIRKERERLALKAPVEGMVFLQPSNPPLHDDAVSEQPYGSYLNSCNEGIGVQAGTAICLIGNATRREAILYVDQKEASLVRRDQRVTILIPQGSSQQQQVGKVIEISSMPVSQQQPEQTGKPPGSETEESRYQVRVSLEESAMPLPVNMTGQARVHITPLSLTSRLIRLFSQSIRI